MQLGTRKLGEWWGRSLESLLYLQRPLARPIRPSPSTPPPLPPGSCLAQICAPAAPSVQQSMHQPLDTALFLNLMCGCCMQIYSNEDPAGCCCHFCCDS